MLPISVSVWSSWCLFSKLMASPSLIPLRVSVARRVQPLTKEIVEETDLRQMVRDLPLCESIVTAGQLATEIACRQFGVEPPKVGEYAAFAFEGRQLRLYRMPSSSRAYPMKLERKAEYYQRVLRP